MKNKVIVAFFLLVFLASTVLAATQINVRTYKDHKVSVFVLKPGEVYTLLDSYHVKSDSKGIASATYSGSESPIKINVKVTKDGETIIFEKFEEEFSTGSPIYLQVIPGKVSTNYLELDAQQNSTQNNSANQTSQSTSLTNQTNETSEVSQVVQNTSNSTDLIPITGQAVNNEKSNIGKILIWSFGIALVLAALILLGFFGVKKYQARMPQIKQHPGKAIIRTKADLTEERLQKQISEAERKIKEAQVELNKIKNVRRIEEIRGRIQREQEELNKLERGEDSNLA